MLRLPRERRAYFLLALLSAFLVAFYFAVRYVANLIEGGADFHELEFAIAGGNMEEIERQLRASAHVDVRAPETGETALHVAVTHSHLEAVKLLLEHGADPNAQNESGATPLLIAVGTNRELVETLIDYGADANLADDAGLTPLHYAARLGNERVVRILAERGAELHAWAEGYEDTPAGLALGIGRIKVAEYILFDAGQGDLSDENVYYLLGAALANHEFDLMRRILDAGVDPNLPVSSTAPLSNKRGVYGFLQRAVIAVVRESIEDLRELAKGGTTINDTDGYPSVPILAIAAMMNNPAIVEFLLEYGLDPNHRTDHGETALHAAARTDAADAARVLIAGGADVNALTKYNRTSVFSAVQSSSPNVLEVLLEEGADPVIPADLPYGLPLTRAKERVREAEKYGASADARERANAVLKLLEQHPAIASNEPNPEPEE